MEKSPQEYGREGGLKSAEVRRRKASMAPEDRALDAIASKLPSLVDELLDAAMGEGDFTDLKPESRLTAILRAMEWKLGKPGSVKPEKPEVAPAVPTAANLFSPSETEPAGG